MDGRDGAKFPNCMHVFYADRSSRFASGTERTPLHIFCHVPPLPEATDSEPDPGSLGHDLRHGGLFFFCVGIWHLDGFSTSIPTARGGAYEQMV